MKLLFIAPRYHTNQVPLVEGLLSKGHQVEFFVERLGATEDYQAIHPRIISRAMFSKLILKLCRNSSNENVLMRTYIPSIHELKKEIRVYKPDVVIVRLQPISTLLVKIISNHCGCKSVIEYNQFTLGEKERINNPKSMIIFLYRKLFSIRTKFTPVISNKIDFETAIKGINHCYFVPFVQKISTKKHRECDYSCVKILDVGKYRDYKNHKLLIEAINNLKGKVNAHYTIIGQCTTEQEKSYYEELKERINDLDLNEYVELRTNVPYSEMSREYDLADIFILPSKNELASIAVLEAMSHGLAVISTNRNGTACYVSLARGGLLFESCNAKSLADTICSIIENQIVDVMGKNGCLFIERNCTIEAFINQIQHIAKVEFGVDLS